MLEYAKKHEAELNKMFAERTFDFDYLYAQSSVYRSDFKLPENTWESHCFASLADNRVIGYIFYTINRESGVVSSFCIEHFEKKHPCTFGHDVFSCIKDIFEKFHFRKMNFSVIIGNPVEKTYDRIIARYGGRVVGTQLQEVKLMDGLLHDVKLYEILSADYFNRLGGNRP